MSKIVLVTGGTAGIGLALAEAFLERGDKVVVCGRSLEAIERFERDHPGALAIRADVVEQADRTRMLDEIEARFGGLDVLVNNAGTFVERDFRESESMAGLDAEVAVNLTAPIQLTGEVLARWPGIGSLVFVTSGFALVSPSRAPTYGAVKAGLHGFAEGLRRQLAAKGTHVLELLPPLTDTQMNAKVEGRKMSPADVAAVTLEALEKRREMALPGDARHLPLMLRLAPRMLARMMGNA